VSIPGIFKKEKLDLLGNLWIDFKRKTPIRMGRPTWRGDR
jgi:hypothetical protein